MNKEMNGYAGKIGIVNLKRKTSDSIETDQGLNKKTPGARDFVIKFLYDLIPERADPLGEGNVVIFAAGSLNVTLSPIGSH